MEEWPDVNEEEGMESEAGQERQFEPDDHKEFDRVELPLLDFLVPRPAGQQERPILSYALLSGPPKSGKSSLLLQLAFNLAVDPQARVIFICKPQNFESDYIYRPLEVDSSGEPFGRVHIKYINNDQDLRKYFAAFHLHVELPSAVIVDDFVAFFGGSVGRQDEGIQGRAKVEMPLVKTLALCRSAIEYANEKATRGRHCTLVISDTHSGDGPRLLYIFKRWLSQAFVIKALDDFSTYFLEAQDLSSGVKGKVGGRYTLESQILHFDGLQGSPVPVVDTAVPD